MSRSLPLRRSERTTKGKIPARYMTESEVAIENVTEKNPLCKKQDEKLTKKLTETDSKMGLSERNTHSISTNKSKKSTIRRKQLELEVEKAKKIAEIDKNIIEKEIALKKAELEEQYQSSKGSSIDDKETEEDIETVTSKSSYIQQWVNSVHPEANVSSAVDIKNIDPVLNRDINTLSELKINQFMARQSFNKDLPVFNGESGEWMTFITQFKESTKICGFSNTENIIRLQKSLKGKAKESVNALLSFTQEVDKIIETLEKRFGRSETIIQDLIDAALKIPSLKEDKIENILDFSNKVQNVAVTINSLKGEEYLCNPQLLNDLTKKLTTTLKIEWGKRIVERKRCNKKENPVNILEFSQWLEEISEAAMYAYIPDQEQERKKKYVCTTSLQNEKIVYKCKFCKKDGHKVEKCNDFKKLDIENRWDWVRQNKVCFSCLTSSHQTKLCRQKGNCGINGCIFKHNPLLHKENTSNEAEQTNHCVNGCEINEVLLRIAPVEVSGPNGKLKTYALFDEASTVTMMDATLAEKIGAVGPTEPLRIRWTNSMTCQEEDSRKVSIKIRGENENEEYVMNNVRTVENLSLPVQSVDVKNLKKKWDHLKQINLPSFNAAKPSILIGQDHINLIIPREVFEGGKNAPVLSKSKLGWVIHGSICTNYNGRSDEEFSLFVKHERDDLDELVRNSFKIENLGVKHYENLQNSEDRQALEILDRTTRRINPKRWESGLLWKNEDLCLTDSKTTAMKRLKSIEKKMDMNPQFAEEYEKKISEYLTKGYAKKLAKDEICTKKEKIWYLPHFAVSNPNKPGKIRFVFDAAAKTCGKSLNDYLLKGPDLLNSLLGVIFKFRQRRIAFTADIMEMFHQIHIRPQDRPAQRFLWRGRERCSEPQEFEMVAMIFGASSSPCTATFVMRRNAAEFIDTFPGAERAIREHHYVDDYLDSVDTIEEAKLLVSSVIEVHGKGGFTIRNWSSNSKEVLRSIPEEYRNLGAKEMDFGKDSCLPIEKVLGLFWNPNDDNFSFAIKWSEHDLRHFSGKSHVTKREVLRIVMTIFDPFGFLNNFTVKARILLQTIWRSKIGWDDELNEEMMKKWRKWVRQIENISNLSIPRCYLANIFEIKSIQLHVFCDASSQAYAAVAYLRIETEKSVRICFVMSKSRVAPLKPVSIPRLELQAAVLGCRLSTTIRENHSIKIDESYFWSDSKTVINWIGRDPAVFQPFVAHRVAEIQEKSDTTFWKWVSTKENVADEATRDDTINEWQSSSRWLSGPDFLMFSKDKWPESVIVELDESSEMKKKFVGFTMENASNLGESLPDAFRFSSWLRLLRSTAWALRFIDIMQRRIQHSGELLPVEMSEAEKLWTKYVQWQNFSEDIQNIQNNVRVESTSRIFKLSPILDNDGILRVKSRIINSNDLAEDTKFPIILDPKNYYTKLLIFYHHLKAQHNGQEYVTNELRQRYWILNVRSAVRSSWNNCQWCKNKRATYQIPEMGPLPACRLTSYVRPFTIVGMDYFGPMNVSIGRRREKRYGVLFTCMSVRAVHLEIAHSLSTDSAIMAIRRFIGRRGYPKKIYSDNGTNLRGAQKELKDALSKLDQSQIVSTLTTKEIEWHFIPPSAPHMGGSWERLIRSIKTSLNVILKEKAPREEILQTLFIEAEYTVNCRPLVHVSLDHADDEALTPNHFLLGTSSGVQIPGRFEEHDMVSRKHWRISQLLADHFWRRWIREYLPVLSKRTKWFNPSIRKIKLGDVVVVVDSEFCRNVWPKGVVTAVYPGTDGQVRVVDVKTNMGIFKRPVAKLCILDIQKEN